MQFVFTRFSVFMGLVAFAGACSGVFWAFNSARAAAPQVATSAAPAPSTQDGKKYLLLIQHAADALLENAVDTYDPQKTGMIISVLDCKTAKPLEELPRHPPFGVRYTDRTGVYGSNANLQQDLYRTLEQLSRLTGDPRYAQAAQTALVDFLRITQNEKTGLLAWGEHIWWDCLNEQPGSLQKDVFTHEPKRKFIYFDKLYQLEPQRTLAYARGLWEHQIYDQKTGNFSRHAGYDFHKPRKDYDFAKEGSYFIDTWSQAYAKTKDPLFSHAVDVLASRYLGKAGGNKLGLIQFDSSGAPDRAYCVTLWDVSLALECADAAKRMDADLARKLNTLAEGQDQSFLSLQHEPDDPTKGFICYAELDTGLPHPRKEKKTEGYSAHWGMGYGINTTAMFGLLCNSRQAQLGEGKTGDAYRQLVLRAANVYRTVKPDLKARRTDIWAGEYGMVIMLEIAAHRLTHDTVYLDCARQYADDAIAVYWPDDNVLPRASSATNYYDVISYPDTLMLSMLALYEDLAGKDPKAEISDLNR